MASELTSILRGQVGHFLQRSRLEYLRDADKELFQGKRILHSRCDHDKYRWFTSWFTDERDYPERISVGEEATKITFDVLRLFPNGLRQMREMFNSGEVDKVSEDEGNLYYFGEKANYWIRLITRQGDYNLYVFAYEKW
jgi:hypothetical protein